MPIEFRSRQIFRLAGVSFVSLLLLAMANTPASADQVGTGEYPEVAAPAWDDASRTALQAALADRARHGLDHVDFFNGQDTALEDATDERLSDIALRYASALAYGVADPATLHDPFTLPRPRTDLKPGLAAAVREGRVREWLESLAPLDEDYSRLSRAYADLGAQRRDDSGGGIAGGLLHVGDADPRVEAVVEQLTADGYLAADAEVGAHAAGDVGPPIYTSRIADGVERLQRDFGIATDGVIGPDTLRVLNLGAGDRAQAIAVALERRRWLERNPPRTRIDVNTAAARLSYYRDGVLVDRRRVVVGKPGTETPLLQSPIYRLVANPTWTIPKSIQHGELANVGESYLRRSNMEMKDGWIVQRSGPGNALGLVKFDMRNRHAIYLHDTSAPELFDRSERHRSHGCVRVEDALGFAELLAEDQDIVADWETARAGGEQQFVPLRTPIPVRLIYRNVFVGDDGTIAYRTDPYGWNGPISKALGFEDRRESRLRSDAADIGP